MKDARICAKELEPITKEPVDLADALQVGIVALLNYCKRLERRIEELEKR